MNKLILSLSADCDSADLYGESSIQCSQEPAVTGTAEITIVHKICRTSLTVNIFFINVQFPPIHISGSSVEYCLWVSYCGNISSWSLKHLNFN